MAVPRKRENLRMLHGGKSGNQRWQRSRSRQPVPRDFKHWFSSQCIDRFFEGRLDFGRKALTHTPIDTQHFDGGEGFRFEAQQFARIGHAGLPADGKVLALVAVRMLQRQDY